MLENEIWKDIPGFEGLYQASTEGKVKSLNYMKTGKAKELKASIESSGYLHLVLFKDGKAMTFRLHRLIAMTFLERIPGKDHIDHIDGDRLNNSVSNLRWVSQKENNNFEIYRKRNSEAQKQRLNNPEWKKKEHKKTGDRNKCFKPVEQYREDGVYKRTFPSINDAFKETGVGVNSISRCCNGKQKTAGHYIWKLAS